MIKAVIFDRDGVIIDIEGIDIMSATKAFQELGIELTNEDKTKIVGRHPQNYFKFLEKYNIPYDKFRPRQRELYYEEFDNANLFAETIGLIKRLHDMKLTLALTTTARRKSTNTVLKRAELEDIFNVIVTAEDYKTKKPDPESYILTAKKLGVKPVDCVVVEDSEVGMRAAKSAGMTCIIIPNDFTKKQDFTAADLVVESADEIMKYIEKNK
ncbi:MAG: HAD family phosphatase [Nanoarchaeota archaeon]|nr:HAD family phosphatase [Nanoarchaeota archaeon]